ncbi:MAG: hypothetical protein ACOYMF_05265 [Bacteroidales bacterium]
MARPKKSPFPKVHRRGNFGVIEMADCAYTFEIAGQMQLASPGVLPLATRNAWEDQPYVIGNYKIIPNGATNQLPHEIRDILEENNLSEGVFKRQRGLLWGQGPALYTEKWENNQKVRTWLNDDEIQSWLESFDYEEVLRRAIVDFNHMEGHYAKFSLNRGIRIGRTPMIARVENIGYQKCRFEWPEDTVTLRNIVVGNWYNPNVLGLKSYPIIDTRNPFQYPQSMIFCNMYSFARDFYGLPAFYGALSWIRRGSAIPKILEALTKNTLNVKYHIKSPASYWVDKATALQTKCANEGVQYTDKMLEDLKDETFKQLGNVLSGEQNVGKFFTSEKIMNELNQIEEWEIEAIDMKVKDYIQAQLEISKQADSATTSGLGLHPSLSNIIVDGKLASGSEQLYALKLYLSTEIDIPESIVCKPLNIALAANWPAKKIKIGFYHKVVKTEDQVSPQNRTKNVI